MAFPHFYAFQRGKNRVWLFIHVLSQRPESPCWASASLGQWLKTAYTFVFWGSLEVLVRAVIAQSVPPCPSLTASISIPWEPVRSASVGAPPYTWDGRSCRMGPAICALTNPPGEDHRARAQHEKTLRSHVEPFSLKRTSVKGFPGLHDFKTRHGPGKLEGWFPEASVGLLAPHQ